MLKLLLKYQKATKIATKLNKWTKEWREKQVWGIRVDTSGVTTALNPSLSARASLAEGTQVSWRYFRLKKKKTAGETPVDVYQFPRFLQDLWACHYIMIPMIYLSSHSNRLIRAVTHLSLSLRSFPRLFFSLFAQAASRVRSRCPCPPTLPVLAVSELWHAAADLPFNVTMLAVLPIPKVPLLRRVGAPVAPESPIVAK